LRFERPPAAASRSTMARTSTPKYAPLVAALIAEERRTRRRCRTPREFSSHLPIPIEHLECGISLPRAAPRDFRPHSRRARFARRR
jgi:hypothetical protein